MGTAARLQRDCSEIAARLQRDCSEIAAGSQRDCGEIAARLRRDCGEIAARLQRDCTLQGRETRHTMEGEDDIHGCLLGHGPWVRNEGMGTVATRPSNPFPLQLCI